MGLPKKEEESEAACYAKGSPLREILQRPKLIAFPDARIQAGKQSFTHGKHMRIRG